MSPIITHEDELDLAKYEKQLSSHLKKVAKLQRSVADSQKKLADNIARRAKIVSRYKKNLEGLPIGYQGVLDDVTPAHHLMVMQYDCQSAAMSKREYYKSFAQMGVQLSVHYYPVHLHAAYRALGYREGMYPNSERYYRDSFSYPLYPALRDEDVDYICDHMRSAIRA